MLQSGICGIRMLHTTVVLNANLGKVMRKVLTNSGKRKRAFCENAPLPTAEMLSKGSNEGRHSSSAKRVSVLNKLFMKHVTDLLQTGEYASLYTGYGIEIHKVQVAPDFNGLNVFWTSSSMDDEEVGKFLKKNAGYLRHELSSLRVIGNVPHIYFVKDKHFFTVREIDSRLSKADFGEDHEPVELEKELKSQLELITKLPLNIKDKIKILDSTFEENVEEDSFPVMPQNVLNLPQTDIMERIKNSMKKSKAPHRTTSSYEISQQINEHPIEFASRAEKREELRKFLQQREILKSKARRLEKQYLPDMQYIRQELAERQNVYLQKFDYYDDKFDSEHYGEDEE